jgi:anti-sigma factor ChrR (cupin superfamily)
MEVDANAWRGDSSQHQRMAWQSGNPEYIYVLQGIFLEGAREYPAGSFVHNPVGSSRIPQSATGCKLLVILPAG